MTILKRVRILSLFYMLALAGGNAVAGGKGHNDHGNGHGYGHCYHGNGNGYGHDDDDCDDDDDYDHDHDDDCDWGHVYLFRLSNMKYPTIISGYRQNVVLSPWDSNAAVFKVWGIPYARVRVKVRNNTGYMYSYYGDYIKTTNFTYGGSVDSDGYGYLDRYGFLTNIRVGGTAKVRPRNKDQYYENYFNLEVFYE